MWNNFSSLGLSDFLWFSSNSPKNSYYKLWNIFYYSSDTKGIE